MRKLKARRGAFSFEYAVVIVCIVAGLIAMQIYITRGMQGRFRQSADSIGEQYAPEDTTSDTRQNFNSDSHTVTTTIDINGRIETTTVSNVDETQTRSGSERVGPLSERVGPWPLR